MVVVQGGNFVEVFMGIVVEGVIVGVMFIGSGPNGGLNGGKQ